MQTLVDGCADRYWPNAPSVVPYVDAWDAWMAIPLVSSKRVSAYQQSPRGASFCWVNVNAWFRSVGKLPVVSPRYTVSSVPVYCQYMSIVPLCSAVPIALSLAMKLYVTVKPCACSTCCVMLASSSSSANALLPMDTVAPLPLDPDGVGQPDVAPAELLVLLPPPHATSVAGRATARAARIRRFMNLSSLGSAVDALRDDGVLDERERPVREQCERGDHDGPHENDAIAGVDARGDDVAQASPSDEVAQGCGS